jgi:hypothetical protein
MLHSMNTITGVSLARTPDRLDSMNEDIRSRGLYLPIVVVVAGGGDADGDDDVRLRSSKTRSSMSGGGRAQSS